jgi:hypothetical protein
MVETAPSPENAGLAQWRKRRTIPQPASTCVKKDSFSCSTSWPAYRTGFFIQISLKSDKRVFDDRYTAQLISRVGNRLIFQLQKAPTLVQQLQDFGFPGHRRQASIPEVHWDGRKLVLAVGVIFIGIEDGADRRDETGLNRLNVFCQMSACHCGLGRLPAGSRDAEKVPHEPTCVT